MLSLLFAAVFAYAAYRSQDFLFLVPSLFFVVMLLLSIGNAGKIDSPYIYLSVSAAAFFYSLPGPFVGKYIWKGKTITIDQDPDLFWSVFFTSLLVGLGLLLYGLTQLRKRPNLSLQRDAAPERDSRL